MTNATQQSDGDALMSALRALPYPCARDVQVEHVRARIQVELARAASEQWVRALRRSAKLIVAIVEPLAAGGVAAYYLQWAFSVALSLFVR
jgi:hypothetical protein